MSYIGGVGVLEANGQSKDEKEMGNNVEDSRDETRNAPVPQQHLWTLIKLFPKNLARIASGVESSIFVPLRKFTDESEFEAVFMDPGNDEPQAPTAQAPTSPGFPMTNGIPDSDPPPVYDSQNMAEPKEQGTSGPEPRYRSRTVLYLNPAALRPMNNSDKVVLLGPGTLNGSTPETALALVFIKDLTVEERGLSAMSTIGIAGRGGNNPECLYYHLFTPFGEDISIVSFSQNEPALGRVEKIQISPPYSPGTIKQHIAKTEGKSIYAYSAQLYQDISADAAMVYNIRSSLPDDSVGSTADKPMVLVQPERRAGLYNRPIKVISCGRSFMGSRTEMHLINMGVQVNPAGPVRMDISHKYRLRKMPHDSAMRYVWKKISMLAREYKQEEGAEPAWWEIFNGELQPTCGTDARSIKRGGRVRGHHGVHPEVVNKGMCARAR
ncbi:hypothetical protein C8R44DRAFT_852936 [Mycena epipterygia]|nr:hypothetical protein C8R44DRAFT_852936 [Mycena epipterygia]